MTISLLDEKVLYCGVTTVNKIYFQAASDKIILVDFSYSGGEGTFVSFVKEDIPDTVKPIFLLEVELELNSMFDANNFRGYVDTRKIEEKINNIKL